MDASLARTDEARVMRPTKPCGPDTPTLVSSSQAIAATVTQTPGTPRRARN